MLSFTNCSLVVELPLMIPNATSRSMRLRFSAESSYDTLPMKNPASDDFVIVI